MVTLTLKQIEASGQLGNAHMFESLDASTPSRLAKTANAYILPKEVIKPQAR